MIHLSISLLSVLSVSPKTHLHRQTRTRTHTHTERERERERKSEKYLARPRGLGHDLIVKHTKVEPQSCATCIRPFMNESSVVERVRDA